MIEKKNTINRRKSVYRASVTININENGIEKINLDDYKLECKIARNNLGFIAICKNTKTNKIYLMKVLRKMDIIQNKTVERLSNEFRILSSIYHPFVIELRGVNHTNPKTLNFLYEYIPGGTLNSLIKSNKRLPIESAKFYLASIITILDYLHKKNIVQRNLNPEDIYRQPSSRKGPHPFRLKGLPQPR